MAASANTEAHAFYRRARVYLYPLGGFLLAIVILVCLLVYYSGDPSQQKLTGLASILSATGIGSAVIGAIGWIKSFYAHKQVVAPEGTQIQAHSASTPAQATGFKYVQHITDDVFEKIQKALDRGMEQLARQMDDLSRGIAITYPLVECIAAISDLNSDVEFLQKVVWAGTDRIADIRSVISAAIGPIWIFGGVVQTTNQADNQD